MKPLMKDLCLKCVYFFENLVCVNSGHELLLHR